MEEIPERRFYRVLVASIVLGVSLTIVVVGRVTMRSVGLEWGVPSFGFPLPAYGYTGTSSGERWIALVPLLVDLGVALLVTLPLSYAVLSRLRSGWALFLGFGTALVLITRFVPMILTIGLFTSVEMWGRDLHVDCRTFWVGAPQSYLDFTDLDDVCVVRALELIESRE
jgi:hypothetical protein